MSKSAAKARRAARRLALHLLYGFEQKRYQDDGLLAAGDDDLADAATQTFAKTLFDGFAAERVAVDAAVDKHLKNWTISRLAVIDRCILRLGVYELLYCPDTPAKVAITECIELAKEYGSEGRTAKLVNGVLDAVARTHARIDPAKTAVDTPPAG